MGDGRLTILGHADEARSYDYKELLRTADVWAANLQGRGLGKGHAVGLVSANSVEFILGLLAIWSAGATAAQLDPLGWSSGQDPWSDKVQGQLRRAGGKWIISTVPAASEMLQGSPVLEPGELGTPAPAPATGTPGPEDPALVLFTSGTSGGSKAMSISQGALAERSMAERDRRHAGDPGSDLLFTCRPINSWSVTTDLLVPLTAGTSVVRLPTQLYMRNPSRWLTEISRWGATHSYGTPSDFTRAAHQIESGQVAGLDLSRWRLAGPGGERLHPAMLERFAAAAAKFGFDERAFSPSFGMGEVGGVSSAIPFTGARVDRIDASAVNEGHAVPATEGPILENISCGPPFEGVRLRIVDEDGVELPERRVGELHINARGAMDEYLGDPELTAQTIVDGWVRSGDLAYLADGELFIVGRVKDSIIVRGTTYSAEDIEGVVLAAGIIEGACAAVGKQGSRSEELVMFIETSLEGSALDDAVQRLKQAVFDAIGISPAELVVLSPGELPRSAGGKIQRAKLRERLS